MRITAAFLLFSSFTACPASADPVWRELEPRLTLAEVRLARPSEFGDSTATVLRVDPASHDLVLLSGRAGGGVPRPARAWARNHGLLAATNAGMFEPDGRTTGYGRTGDQVVNARWRARDKAVLVAGPRERGIPHAQLLDRDCDDVEAIAAKYQVVLQGIRMVSCQRENTWARGPRRWSSIIVATDGAGHILFIHTRSPYAMHDYVELVLAAGLDVRRAMYLEGGPEASLYVSAGGVTVERVGSYETGFNENDANLAMWDLPNVLGVRRRAGR